jgi:hypothetical protein
VTELARLYARSDTAIFIVGHDTELCATMLGLLRAPGTLSPSAAALFENIWGIYKNYYARGGAAFGALVHSRMKARGPVTGMCGADQVAKMTEILSLKARSITRADLTPIFVDHIFETAAASAAAELSATKGSA